MSLAVNSTQLIDHLETISNFNENQIIKVQNGQCKLIKKPTGICYRIMHFFCYKLESIRLAFVHQNLEKVIHSICVTDVNSLKRLADITNRFAHKFKKKEISHFYKAMESSYRTAINILDQSAKIQKEAKEIAFWDQPEGIAFKTEAQQLKDQTATLEKQLKSKQSECNKLNAKLQKLQQRQIPPEKLKFEEVQRQKDNLEKLVESQEKAIKSLSKLNKQLEIDANADKAKIAELNAKVQNSQPVHNASAEHPVAEAANPNDDTEQLLAKAQEQLSRHRKANPKPTQTALSAAQQFLKKLEEADS